MVGGHTHLQMVRRHQGMTFINPGSVGMPYDRPPLKGKERFAVPQAEYAVLSWRNGILSIKLRRVLFDLEALFRAAIDNNMTQAEWWAKTYWGVDLT